jgi:hypothetical protein
MNYSCVEIIKATILKENNAYNVGNIHQPLALSYGIIRPANLCGCRQAR